MKKFLSLRWLVILPGVVAYLLNQYAQYHPNWAEQYSRTAYPIVSNAVGFLPSLVKFSVSEWLAVAVLLFLPVYLGYYLHQVIISKGDRGMAVYRASLGIVAMASVIYFCFTLLGGLNYYRDSFLAYTPYHEETYSEEELVKLCQSLADEMGQTRERLGEDHDFRLRAPDDFYYYAQQSVLSIQLLAKMYVGVCVYFNQDEVACYASAAPPSPIRIPVPIDLNRLRP